ncbi:hypothetical protein [Nocardia asiatica]|uniref:hypothetical protein n=1 Tax=Nocardia asiatica TaxID=209252 RepID=UPI0035715716
MTGTGLTGATAVNFGATPATSFTVDSATPDHGYRPRRDRNRATDRHHSGRNQ